MLGIGVMRIQSKDGVKKVKKVNTSTFAATRAISSNQTLVQDQISSKERISKTTGWSNLQAGTPINADLNMVNTNQLMQLMNAGGTATSSSKANSLRGIIQTHQISTAGGAYISQLDPSTIDMSETPPHVTVHQTHFGT